MLQKVINFFWKEKPTILVVCTGNTCRSPMAEVVLSFVVGHKYNVESAGISATDGKPASEIAVAVISKLPKPMHRQIRKHQSRRLTTQMIDKANRIFAMTEGHRQSILEMASLAKVELLSDDGNDISDPYGGDYKRYGQCFDEIVAAVADRIRVKKDLI